LNKSNFIHVGTFGPPVGLKGEIKVNLLTSSFEFFKNLKIYYGDNFLDKYIFDNMRATNNKVIVHLENFFTRTDVEKLKGKKIFSKSTSFPKTEKNQYYFKDLIGCSVNLLDGNIIGEVISVDNFGAGDLIEVKMNRRKIYIPLDKDNLISVNIESKEILVNPIKGVLN
tara:strand:- start:298 stop:804 length:507 start_codon:yes stop_codon:yes gene_type:complete